MEGHQGIPISKGHCEKIYQQLTPFCIKDEGTSGDEQTDVEEKYCVQHCIGKPLKCLKEYKLNGRRKDVLYSVR